jgi:DNA (cytosine-5)-methyltransferase 1
MKQLTFLDLCSGIGGFRLGLENAGHKCIGYCEYDKYARASYEAMYDTKGEWFADDITKLKPENVPYADIWCFGFPCQDISVAGKQRGLRGKRSGIYYNIIDLVKGKEESGKPTYLLVENVKNLLSVNGGFDFAAVLSEMDEAGYDTRWQVLNSKDFGVPQNRERVFLIANLRSRGRREILSVTREDGSTLEQIIGGLQGYRVYDPDGVSVTLGANGGGMGAKTGLYFIDQCSSPKVTEVARCIQARYNAGIINYPASNSGVMEVHAVLTPERMEKRQNGRRMKEDGEPMFTLTGQDRHGVYLCKKSLQEDKVELPIRNGTKQGYDIAHSGDGICLAYPKSATRRGRVGKGCSQTLDTGCQMGAVLKCGRIRRLTPRECFRLQGFPDTLYERAAAVNSESQLYKQAGNAVTATVAYEVAMALPESREAVDNCDFREDEK